jgi:signal transduction histidine kinase
MYLIENKTKSLWYIVVAFWLPLLITFLLIQIEVAGGAYRNTILHAVLMLTIVAVDFYIAYIAYETYCLKKNTTIFFATLAFLAAAVSHVVHSLMAADMPVSFEDIFDLSEHFSIFILSVLLLVGFLYSPSKKMEDVIYRYKNRIIGIFLASSVAMYVPLFFIDISDGWAITLVDIIIALTGVVLVFLVFNLWTRYQRMANDFLFYAIIGITILINATIIPFVYREWGLCWWYFHVIIVAGNLFFVYGLWKINSDMGKMADALAKIPFYSRTLTRLLVFFVLALAIGPLLINGYINFNIFRSSLEKQTIDNLNVVAESKEGHLFSFLTKMDARAADFSSDGLIRDLTSEIVRDPNGSAYAARLLSDHLKVNKMSLSQSIYGINIIGLSGKIIASTNAVEIGKDESADDYFKRTLARNYGESIINDANISHHFAVEKKTITASAPIYDRRTGKSVGIIVNYYDTSELDDILAGRQQMSRGAISGMKGFGPTLDIYLVNSDGMMISESRFLGKEVFLKQPVDTMPVRNCRENKESAGQWTNYLGNNVSGASMCLYDPRWTLVVEMSQAEILLPLGSLRQSLVNSIAITALFIIVFGLYFSRRLSRPIESLINTAGDIIGGNFGARAVIRSHDEIGELGKSFNVMLDRLEHFTKTINSERKKLEVILDSLPMAVSIIDGDFKIQYANWVFKKTFGSKCMGEKCYILSKDNKQICPNCPLKEIGSTTEKSGVVEVDGLAGGRTYSIIHSPFEDENGRKLVIEVYRDVTKEREIDSAKSEFISVASHQLRTPLTAISWYIEMLLSGERGKLTSKQKSYMKEVADGGRRMSYLINDLLNLSRIEAGKIRVEPVSVKVDAFIQKVIEDFKPVAAEKSCNIIFNKTNVDFPNIMLDQNLLRQVILNLLANAVSYSREGQCSIKVGLGMIGDLPSETCAGANCKNVLVSVKDSGIGIPKEEQGRIFEKFFRAPNALKRVTAGTGLGLYISKLVLESLGGKIWFESAEGEGTTFYFTLPLSGAKRREE